MNSLWTISRNSMYLLFSMFLLNSCSSTSEKTEPKVHIVEIKDMRFQPAEITVQKGDTVVWKNKDFVAHDVAEEATQVWSSSVIPNDGSWSMVVTESADYFCTIHQVMKGKIVVKEQGREE